ncbi:MAG: hypothetical protein KatS3mg109_1481 [Pirellulaceae bacterium]|nr:MAG: hypothetical protein KatS3mg109_1481 [Pirellulaceae bacterium]GIW93779.1 MAG: hypothetical protein KatS3mg110_1820 [Pirellulaceae bacterium]
MTVIPTGLASSLAASPISQTASHQHQAAEATVQQVRQADGARRASEADGVDRAQEDSPTQDRDADGRRPWELQRFPDRKTEDPSTDEPDGEKRVPDPTGEAGQWLDLLG